MSDTDTETSTGRDFETDQYGGYQATDGTRYERFRLVSSIEKQAMLDLLTEVSGLREDQVAMNSWGFPFMPIPEPRPANGRMRLAPSNTSEEFLGHPIFWIDPKLSQRREGESDEYWSIRMYYTLRASGYWSEEGRADFLKFHGFDFSPADVEAYHLDHNPEISIDKNPKFRFIDESDIKIGLEEVDKIFIEAMEKCNRSLHRELSSFMERQIVAFAHARDIIGRRQYLSPRLAPDSEGSLWLESIQPEINAISQRYDQMVANGEPISAINTIAFKKFNEFQEMIITFSYISTVLSIPIVRSLDTPFESYALMVSYMGLAGSQASHREGDFDVVTPLQEAFDSREEGAINNVILKHVWPNYVLVWKQMRLALVNYIRMRDGQEVFENYSDMQQQLVGDSEELTPMQDLDQVESLRDGDYDDDEEEDDEDEYISLDSLRYDDRY